MSPPPATTGGGMAGAGNVGGAGANGGASDGGSAQGGQGPGGGAQGGSGGSGATAGAGGSGGAVAVCGDGVMQAGEGCDDGNMTDNDDCPDGPLGTCQPASCSDGILHDGGTGTETGVDCGGASCPGCGEGLLLSEIEVRPAGTEFIEIHNPTAVAVSLEGLYLADYADYYLITQGMGAPGASELRVTFPAGSSIPAGGHVVVAVGSATDFNTAYGAMPDFDLDAADMGAPAMAGDIGTSAELANNEMLVLFRWDGTSDSVIDIDYVVWGNTTSAMDKSGVVVGSHTYAAETAVVSQDATGAPGNDMSAARCIYTESTEADSGANGFDGADETSEPLSATWMEVAPSPGTFNDCPVIVTVEPETNNLRHLDRATFAELDAIPITSTVPVAGMVAMSRHRTSGVVYGVIKEMDKTRHFAHVNTATGVATVVGPTSGPIATMAHDQTDVLVAMVGDAADGAPALIPELLIDVDPLTGASTIPILLLTTNACCGEALLGRPGDPLLYRFSGRAVPLFESIDMNAPSHATIGHTGDMPQEVTGGFWDPALDAFVVFDRNLDAFTVAVDGTTTATTTIAHKTRGALIQ